MTTLHSIEVQPEDVGGEVCLHNRLVRTGKLALMKGSPLTLTCLDCLVSWRWDKTLKIWTAWGIQGGAMYHRLQKRIKSLKKRGYN